MLFHRIAMVNIGCSTLDCEVSLLHLAGCSAVPRLDTLAIPGLELLSLAFALLAGSTSWDQAWFLQKASPVLSSLLHQHWLGTQHNLDD